MKNIFLLCMMVILSLVPTVVAQDDENLVAFVAADSPINVRERPSSNGRVITSLPPNFSVSILRQSDDGGWFEVQLPDGQTGWVSASLVRVVESAIPNDLEIISPENASRLEEITQFASTLSNGFAFSPDGRLLASYSWMGSINIYDVRTKILITSLTNHADVVTKVVFSPDGREMASSGWDANVRIWNTESWGERTIFAGHLEAVTAIAYSPDGTKIASVGKDDKLIIWDVQTGERLLEINSEIFQVFNLAFSPDGTRIAASGDYQDSVITVWDAVSGEEIWSTRMAGNLHLSFLPDGRLVYVRDSNSLEIWGMDAENYNMSSFFISNRDINGGASIAVHPAGNLVAVGTWARANSGFLIADIAEEDVLFVNNLQVDTGISLAFSPDGRVLALSDNENSIYLWGVHGE